MQFFCHFIPLETTLQVEEQSKINHPNWGGVTDTRGEHVGAEIIL